jgi:molecular chaperone GrpE (heat shock protein)
VTRTRLDRSQERAAQAASIAEIQKSLADVGKSVPQIHHALEEVAEDNMALSRAIKGVSDHQESLRTDVCREIDRLRTDVAGELLSQALRHYCRELSPALSAVERMLADADLADAAVTRQHLESLAMTLQSALLRMGIERLDVAVGRDPFDSRVHDCVRTCTAEDSPIPDAARGVVVLVQEHGYVVHGKIAQPAKVWVQQAPHESGQAERDTACDTTKS